VVLEETNSGGMILATIYYIVRGCPFVHFKNDLLRLRSILVTLRSVAPVMYRSTVAL